MQGVLKLLKLCYMHCLYFQTVDLYFLKLVYFEHFPLHPDEVKSKIVKDDLW